MEQCLVSLKPADVQQRLIGTVTLRSGTLSCCLLLIVSVFMAASGCSPRNEPAVVVDKTPESKHDIGTLISSEETILKLTPRLKLLNRAVMNLSLPIDGAVDLFADQFQANDLTGEFSVKQVNSYIESQDWNVSATENSTPKLWQSVFDSVAYFERAKFYFVDGKFDSDLSSFKAHLGFTGVAKLKNGGIANFKSKVTTDWSWQRVDSSPQLRIANWQTDKFNCTVSASKMFEDVTDRLLSDWELAKQLSGSHHMEVVKRSMTGGQFRIRADDPYPRVFPEVTLEHPGISVVDLNGDGWDDFFLARPMQTSLFFMNNGDGSFSEVSKTLGLDVAGGLDGGCTCALFADYDNDGDLDVFIGRARQRLMYLENVKNLHFQDATKNKLVFDPPFMVSSLSAADYNNDGLLDLYVSTYSPIEGSQGGRTLKSGAVWPHVFLRAESRSKYFQRLANAHLFVDMVGPSNMLLENQGKAFVVSPHSPSVECWRKTFQTGWSDFDNDGDQDLYVCNDFAPDDLFRNNGDQGFVRVNEQAGLEKIGFGMGVSWGDHNQDGNIDLYVSNMFSKAGSRITAQIDGVDPRMKDLAKGNYLYELNDGKFSLVSDVGGPHETVAHAGWSWGSQFCDVDNDGALDIFAASGYYSAPPEFAEEVDL